MFAGNAFGQPYFGQVSQGGTIPAANPATADYIIAVRPTIREIDVRPDATIIAVRPSIEDIEV